MEMCIGGGRRGVVLLARVFAVLVCAALAFGASLQLQGTACAEDGSGSASASASESASSAAASESSSAAAESSSSSAKPEPVLAGDPFDGAVQVDLDDGLYLVFVTLEGGSGRASVESPAEFEVFDGRGVVKLVWSSSHYDYMIVDGKKYLKQDGPGNSTFVIPVLAYDEPMAVIGDTTAMGEAHEVDYTLTVQLGSVRPYEGEKATSSSASGSEAGSTVSASNSASQSQSQAQEQAQEPGLSWPWIVFIVCVVLSAVCIGFTIGLLRNYRGR